MVILPTKNAMSNNTTTTMMDRNMPCHRPTVDPILTLQVPPSNSSSGNSYFHSPYSNHDDEGELEDEDQQQQPQRLAGNRSSISAVCFLSSQATYLSQNQQRQEKEHDEHHEESSSDDDEEEEEELNLRCRRLGVHSSSATTTRTSMNHHLSSSSLSNKLSGMILASCHTNGDAFLWDLGRRRIVSSLFDDDQHSRPRGPGITLRRLGDGAITAHDDDNNHHNIQFLYHTRDPHGTVSIHQVDSSSSSASSTTFNFPIVTSYSTYSRTFCAASPCWGSTNLIIMPTDRETHASVRDVRCSPTSAPAMGPFAASAAAASTTTAAHGMITSLAMATKSTAASSQGDGRRYGCCCSRHGVVACGMESGHIFYHDMAMPRHALPKSSNISDTILWKRGDGGGQIKLGNDPILALDMATSTSSAASRRLPPPPRTEASVERREKEDEEEEEGMCCHHSVLTVAGMAGDAADLCELPRDQQGTVALLKTTFCAASSSSSPAFNDTNPTIRIRARWNTCDIQDPLKRGKPGVATCRFRPDDGRLVAVGGWDYRLRIYHRTKTPPSITNTATASSLPSTSPSLLAILKGHSASVTAVDWAPRQEQQLLQQGKLLGGGLLATGAGDGRIHIWNI
jgi:hypothetical protein